MSIIALTWQASPVTGLAANWPTRLLPLAFGKAPAGAARRLRIR